MKNVYTFRTEAGRRIDVVARDLDTAEKIARRDHPAEKVVAVVDCRRARRPT